MDSAHRMKAALRSNSRHGFERVKSDQSVTRGAFDGMEMQSMSVCKAFHEGRFVGNRWQMPSVQKHGVHTYSVRVNACDCGSNRFSGFGLQSAALALRFGVSFFALCGRSMANDRPALSSTLNWRFCFRRT